MASLGHEVLSHAEPAVCSCFLKMVQHERDLLMRKHKQLLPLASAAVYGH